ncbi:MAG: ATP-dependent protease subunit HslV [bacterium]
MQNIHGTTVIALKRDGISVMAADGQVTMGDVVMKEHARKIRRLYKDQVIAGFAGSVADAFALFEKFEVKLEEFRGNLLRASVELAKEWRTDKYLRRLEAMLIVISADQLLIVSGNGDVIEPDGDIIAIGSGGNYALAAARAMMQHTQMKADEIATASMEIAAGICIHTNSNIQLETLK